jgi:hypothetical protein
MLIPEAYQLAHVTKVQCSLQNNQYSATYIIYFVILPYKFRAHMQPITDYVYNVAAGDCLLKCWLSMGQDGEERVLLHPGP